MYHIHVTYEVRFTLKPQKNLTKLLIFPQDVHTVDGQQK